MNSHVCWGAFVRRGPKLMWALTLGVGLTLTACRKSGQPANELPPPALPPPNQPASAATTLGLPPVPPSTNSGPRLPQHSELFNAFYKFVNDKSRVPRNVEELVAERYLSPLPPPPPGKRYQLNNQSLELRLVNQ